MAGVSHFARRAPFLVLGAAGLLGGLYAGLLRLGLDLPDIRDGLAADHGPLMVLGFLGTVISLERAVALGRRWAFAAPLGFGAGALATVFDWQDAGGWLFLAGAAVLVAIFVQVLRIQSALHTAVMGLGAVAAVIAANSWLDARPPIEVAAWLSGFLVLTITGERLELARFARLTPRARSSFVLAIVIFSAGLVVLRTDAAVGSRVIGAGLLALAAWLARYDIARRTIRQKGLTRYMAACLLAGYGWLAVAGGVWLVSADAYGWAYDAKLHAVFVGFTISMVFGHAAVIFPAVFGVVVPYRRVYWVHLIVLHAGLALRLLGDAMASEAVWKAGGVANEAAIVLFIVVTGIASFRATRRRARRRHPAAAAPA